MVIYIIFPMYLNNQSAEHQKPHRQKFLDSVHLPIKTKLETFCVWDCYYFLIFYVWGSCSGPIAPWLISCTGTSRGPNRFIGKTSPQHPNLSPEVHKLSLSYWATSKFLYPLHIILCLVMLFLVILVNGWLISLH